MTTQVHCFYDSSKAQLLVANTADSQFRAVQPTENLPAKFTSLIIKSQILLQEIDPNILKGKKFQKLTIEDEKSTDEQIEKCLKAYTSDATTEIDLPEAVNIRFVKTLDMIKQPITHRHRIIYGLPGLSKDQAEAQESPSTLLVNRGSTVVNTRSPSFADESQATTEAAAEPTATGSPQPPISVDQSPAPQQPSAQLTPPTPIVSQQAQSPLSPLEPTTIVSVLPKEDTDQTEAQNQQQQQQPTQPTLNASSAQEPEVTVPKRSYLSRVNQKWNNIHGSGVKWKRKTLGQKFATIFSWGTLKLGSLLTLIWSMIFPAKSV